MARLFIVILFDLTKDNAYFQNNRLDVCLRENERMKRIHQFFRLRVDELIAHRERASDECAAWRTRAEHDRCRLEKLRLLIRNFELTAPESLNASTEESESLGINS